MMEKTELDDIRRLAADDVERHKAVDYEGNMFSKVVLQLVDEVSALRETLSFYADPESYELFWDADSDPNCPGYRSPIEIDGGNAAAEAL